jgi:hypothetical protein
MSVHRILECRDAPPCPREFNFEAPP